MAADTGSVRPFVGRAEVVAGLHRRFEEARAGTGGVTLLVGDTGVGKSTLVEDLVRKRGELADALRKLVLHEHAVKQGKP